MTPRKKKVTPKQVPCLQCSPSKKSSDHSFTETVFEFSPSKRAPETGFCQACCSELAKTKRRRSELTATLSKIHMSDTPRQGLLELMFHGLPLHHQWLTHQHKDWNTSNNSFLPHANSSMLLPTRTFLLSITDLSYLHESMLRSLSSSSHTHCNNGEDSAPRGKWNLN